MTKLISLQTDAYGDNSRHIIIGRRDDCKRAGNGDLRIPFRKFLVLFSFLFYLVLFCILILFSSTNIDANRTSTFDDIFSFYFVPSTSREEPREEHERCTSEGHGNDTETSSRTVELFFPGATCSSLVNFATKSHFTQHS